MSGDDAAEGDDLRLAAACVAGDAAAIAAFDRTFAPVIARAIATLGLTPSECEDVQQIVRARLLVPTVTDGGEQPARLASFAGKGSLAAWVRVVATREAQRLLPRARREVAADDSELDRMLGRDDDPEVAYLKRLYRAELKDAVAATLAALSDRERLVLQQHAIDRLGIDELAQLHRVHRATAARWVEAARRAVVEGVRRELVRRLQLSRGELDSILRLISSQLDVSLPRLLGR